MEKLCGVAEVQPRFDTVIGGLVDGNAVMRAQQGGAHASSADHGEKRFLNGVIDPQAAKGNATRLAIVHPAAAAAVARDVMLRARVAKRQLAPAAAATKQARQQSVAVLGRTVMAAGGDVAAHHLADRPSVLPADIAFVSVRHQRQPIAARLAANLHANASSIIARRNGGLTIGIGAAVDGVLDHLVDGGFPLIAKAVAALPVRSCFIDGKAIIINSRGLSVFDLLRYRQHDGAAVLCAFDLIEMEGLDFRPSPLEERKDVLGKLCARCGARTQASR